MIVTGWNVEAKKGCHSCKWMRVPAMRSDRYLCAKFNIDLCAAWDEIDGWGAKCKAWER